MGTVRANKKFMPKEVMNANLKKGEIITREDKNGIVVLNWLDTRYVRVLTRKHAPEMVDINANSDSTSRQKNKQKPLLTKVKQGYIFLIKWVPIQLL